MCSFDSFYEFDTCLIVCDKHPLKFRVESIDLRLVPERVLLCAIDDYATRKPILEDYRTKRLDQLYTELARRTEKTS